MSDTNEVRHQQIIHAEADVELCRRIWHSAPPERQMMTYAKLIAAERYLAELREGVKE